MAGSDKIRVLIVDDIAETRENLRKLLQFENDVEVVAMARTGREAIDLAKEVKPDVVLMDINMPDMDGITATESIRRINPFTEIVILSVQGDPNYMRRAMLAGARDFLTKPPSVDELTTAIHRAGRMAQDERAKAVPAAALPGTGPLGMQALPARGKIIFVYSPKGGTGNTTLAVNLAMTLHPQDTPVALVDGDMQFGDVAVFLNEQSRNSIIDLAPRADELDTEIVDEVMGTHEPSGVRILAAPNRPEYAENVTGDQFAKILQVLTLMFRYVVVDGDSSLTDVTLAALDTCDSIVLLTTQDIPSIKNARLFLDLLDVLKISSEKVTFVMNRFDKRIGISSEKVGESMKHPVAAVIPLDEKTVIPAVNRGVPFMLGNRTAPVARSFIALAELLQKNLDDSQPEEEEQPRTGRLRLFGRH